MRGIQVYMVGMYIGSNGQKQRDNLEVDKCGEATGSNIKGVDVSSTLQG